MLVADSEVPVTSVVTETQAGFLYIVSWQVSNRLGGVHTALETSAPFFERQYGQDLLYVGPDLWADAAARATFLEDDVQPEVAVLAEERGLPVRFGRWQVGGGPPCALVGFDKLLERKNEILGELWEHDRVDSMGADWDTIERILFGYAAGKFVELHYHVTVRPRARRAVAHFHEWMTGAGLLHLARSTPEIGTVYTAHGTALGRKIADEGLSLHRRLDGMQPLDAAKERRIEAQQTLETAAVGAAAVVAAVSEHEGVEIEQILGRKPDLVTPNGYTPPPLDPTRREAMRAELFDVAGRFLGAPLDPRTRLAITAGRYEFRNKGLGIALRAAAKLREGGGPPRPLLLFVFVAAPQTGPRPEVVARLGGEGADGPCGVCTHNLARPEADPVLAACRDAGLENAPDDPVKVLFAPVMLDGRDPLFPYTYGDVLQACDLSLFPSLYEPWGYTPVESLAAGVPTITTDLTGFGRFVQSLPDDERAAVTVLPAAESENGHVVDVLAGELRRFLALDDAQLDAMRARGDAVVRRTSWDVFFERTQRAHALALSRAAKRQVSAPAIGLTHLSPRSIVVIPARSVHRPLLHRFTVSAAPPERIAGLTRLANNLWWTWSRAARRLFEELDRDRFHRSGRNPVRFLREIDPAALARAEQDPGFLALYDEVMAAFEAYLAHPPTDAPETAYFCAEFGLHHSLPVYSGGLGVLAGDHLKSASDLRFPLVGVGLYYAEGYFRQRIDTDGTQREEELKLDPDYLPLSEVLGEDGEPLRISLTMPERELRARVWRVDVGRVPLYLMDTNVPENDPADRLVTRRLYPSDRESRLRQEILLGRGGWRLLRALGAVPQVCHLNEGHSAFLLLERVRDLVVNHRLTYAEAVEAVRASSVFTTHTPVPAGHDRFAEDLMRRYFAPLAQRIGLDWNEFFDLGRSSTDHGQFSMTYLALRLSGRANAVSKLHQRVSQKMLAPVWPEIHEAEAPVDAITNGVHLATWVGPEIGALLDARFTPQWDNSYPEREEWTRVMEIPDETLWDAHRAQKRRLLTRVRRLVEESVRRGDESHLGRRLEGIDEDALWIGYARRFAPYKRAGLIFRDPARLGAILDHASRPVRIVMAGKSHPDDGEGRELVRRVVETTRDPRFAGRVFFLEDYDTGLARLLVQGVDVWLNTPTRPLEASGTSGMKASANGIPNLSVLDGWWCEGYTGGNGWVIGEGKEYDRPDLQDEHDARTLYALLESEIVPLYYDRPENAPPAGWLKTMKRALATVPSYFNTHRMVREYLDRAYRPLAQRHAELSANQFAGARAAAERKRRLREAWSDVKILDVSVTDLSAGRIGIGDRFEVRARVSLGRADPADVAVELYTGPAADDGELRDPVVIPLLPAGPPRDGVFEYTGAYLPRGAGTFLYGVRVLPASDTFADAAASGLIRWA